MAIRTPIVAGVFEQEPQARSAFDGLKQAGFEYDQLGVATPGKGPISLSDHLQSLGVPAERAMYYEQALRAGHIVVSVRANGRDQDALDILRRNGASDYDQREPPLEETGTNAVSADRLDTYQQPQALSLREEQLNVSKEKLQTGEVRLRKEIVTEQKTITVPVSHEEVVIEQYPVTNGQIDITPLNEDEVVRIPITEEQISVTKTPVVISEVKLGKHVVQETQQVSDTLKREEVRVEQQGDVRVHATDEEHLSQ
jgi:uncharacterized protein (TIGR02271 family)